MLSFFVVNLSRKGNRQLLKKMIEGCSVSTVMKNALWFVNSGIIGDTWKVTFPLLELLSKEVP